MAEPSHRFRDSGRGDQHSLAVLRRREVVENLFEFPDLLLAFGIDVELCLVWFHQMSGIGGADGGVAAAVPPLSPLIS